MNIHVQYTFHLCWSDQIDPAFCNMDKIILCINALSVFTVYLQQNTWDVLLLVPDAEWLLLYCYYQAFSLYFQPSGAQLQQTSTFLLSALSRLW